MTPVYLCAASIAASALLAWCAVTLWRKFTEWDLEEEGTYE